MSTSIVNEWKISDADPHGRNIRCLSDLMFTDQELTFRRILPLPKILEDISQGSWLVDGEWLDTWIEEPSPESGLIRQRRLTPQEEKELEATGHETRRDACMAFWGSRSDAWDTRITSEGSALLEIQFQTATSPPVLVLKALRERFPSLRIRGRHQDAAEPEPAWKFTLEEAP